MPLSDARKRANEKYFEKKDDIKIRVENGQRAKIKAHAESLGVSLNAYIVELIERDMEQSGD